MNVDLTNLQRQTINAYNDLIKFLNKAQIDEDGFIKIYANELDHKLTQVHNNLAFVGGLFVGEEVKSLWEVEPNLHILSFDTEREVSDV